MPFCFSTTNNRPNKMIMFMLNHQSKEKSYNLTAIIQSQNGLE